MMPDNSPAPLDFNLSPSPAAFRDHLISDAWRMIAKRLANQGSNIVTIANMREAFVSGLYAASASITAERADAQSISEAAFRLEKSR